MNVSYTRKSKYSFKDTLKRLEDTLKKENIKVSHKIDLKKGTLVFFEKKEWLEELFNIDASLVSFMPNPFVLEKREKGAYLSIGKATVLFALNNTPKIQEISLKMEKSLNSIVDNVTEAGPLKPSKIVLYSTMTCPYCNMEKSWLEQKKIDFDIVYVDLNREAGEELVKKTGQMGVPVTEIQYEDMEPEYVIGFNKPVLAKLLGVEP